MEDRDEDIEAGRHARACELLAAASRLPEAERAAFLEREAGDDAHLLAYARSLLASAQRLGDFLEGPGPGAVLAGGIGLGGSVGGDEAEPEPEHHEQLPAMIGTCRIVRLVGEGSMGVVYEGWQESLKRRVAVKVLRTAFPTPAARRRFEREGELLGRLRHPGITEVYEAGFEDLGPGRNVPYIAMELIDGVSIREHCETRRLGRLERVELLAQVCEAVGFAHAQGVLHRDIKPENVLVTPDGRAKLVDFGVARAEDEVVTRYTRTGDVIGTLAYMSPEQAAGEVREVDARSDVHALGILAYELLVGQLPLDLRDLSLLQALNAVRERHTIRMAATDKTLRGGLDSIVGKAVAIDRRHRYENAREMGEDLRRYLAGAPILASPPSLAERMRHRAWRHRRLVVAVCAVMIALAIGLVSTVVIAMREARQRRRADDMAHVATRSQYVRAVSAAGRALDEGIVPGALSELNSTEAPLRGWEWRYLLARTDGGLGTLALPVRSVPRALTASGRSVTVWSAREAMRAAWGGASIDNLPLPEGRRTIAWSADGMRAACRPVNPHGTELSILDIASGSEVTLQVPADIRPRNAAFDPTGDRLLLTAEDYALVLDARTGTVIARVDLPQCYSAPAWSPDGDRYALGCSRDGVESVVVVDPDGGSAPITVPTAFGMRFRFSPSGDHVVAQTRQRILGFWDLARQATTWTLDASAFGRAADFTFSPDGTRLVMTTQEGEALLLAADDGRLVAVLPKASRINLPAAPAFSAHGEQIAVPGALGAVVLVDAKDGRRGATLLGHPSPVAFLAFVDDDRRLVSVDVEGEARLWDVRTPDADILRGHASYVYDVAFSPDGAQLASASWDGTTRLWDVASGDAIAVLGPRGGDRTYGYARISPRGDVLASVHGMTASLWDTRSGQAVAMLELTEPQPWAPTNEKAPRGLAWGRDGAFVAVASLKRDLHVWRLASDRPAAPKLETWPVKAEALAFSPRGDLAAFSVKHDVELWATAPPKRLRTLGSHDGEIFTLVFSSDGTRLASASEDRTVRVWDVAGSGQPTVLRGHAEKVYAVAFSPDGTRLASGGNDGFLRIWDSSSGDALLAVEGHRSYVHAVAFSPDGSVVATASGDNTVRLWDVAPDRVRLAAREARARRVESIAPRVDALFAEEPDAGRVARRVMDETAVAEDRRVALDLVLARGAKAGAVGAR